MQAELSRLVAQRQGAHLSYLCLDAQETMLSSVLITLLNHQQLQQHGSGLSCLGWTPRQGKE